MDGSQKLPQRFLGTIEDAFEAGRETPSLCLSIAAWMFYVCGVDEAGGAIDVRDPLLDDIRALTSKANGAGETVAALLTIRAIFPEDLASRLKAPVTAAAQDLWAFGIRDALERVHSDTSRTLERS
jgi:fructuronate reductase